MNTDTKIPFPFRITREELFSLIKKTETVLQVLGKNIQDDLKPPPGPHSIFYSQGAVIARLKDLENILERLYGGIDSLAQLSLEEERLRPTEWPAGTPYPRNLQEIMSKSGKINAYSQLDLESIYIFGQILLDQWSMLAIAIGSLPLKQTYPFSELVIYLEDNQGSPLQKIWNERSENLLWLYYHLRAYRNQFIIHAFRPLQKGTTRTVYGEEYNLHTPSPVDWFDDKKLEAEIKNLIHLAPTHIQQAKEDYWERARAGRLIEILLDNIGNVNRREDRESISSLFKKKGGRTPTFQITSKRLLEMIYHGTEVLIEVAKNNPQGVNLGAPSR